MQYHLNKPLQKYIFSMCSAWFRCVISTAFSEGQMEVFEVHLQVH